MAGRGDQALTIHLSGPLSGCNQTQREAWRQELAQLLHEFTCTSPHTWGDTWDFSRNLRAVAQCDILVANMWKESIGTTFDIIYARNLGRPIVLIDPNHLENKLLEGFVSPAKPVSNLRKAASLVRELANTMTSFDIRKKDGTFEPFSRTKLIRSVRLAVAEAGIADIEFPNQIIAPVAEALLRMTQTRVATTEDIRDQLFLQLDRITELVTERAFTREAAAAVKEAWRSREARKQGDQAIDALRSEIEGLRNELAARETRIAQLQSALSEKSPRAGGPDGSGLQHPTDPMDGVPPPASVADSLQRAAAEFADCMVVLPQAMDSAADCPLEDPLKALIAIRLLGRCTRERMAARTMGTHFVGPKQWFSNHREEAPWLEYAPHESPTTAGKFGSERTFLVDGRPTFMEQHLKIGAGGVTSTLRIHFKFDEHGRAIIGHCGRHLPNTKS